MTCPNCEIASRRPWHEFTAGCMSCAARAVARSPQFAKARKEGKQDRAYRALLNHFNLTHADVLTAHSADMLGKEAMCDDSC